MFELESSKARSGCVLMSSPEAMNGIAIYYIILDLFGHETGTKPDIYLLNECKNA